MVDDTPRKSLFNEPFNAIFVETFQNFDIGNNYMLGVLFPYLEVLSGPCFVEDNLFGSMTHINQNNLKYKI